MGYLRGDIEHVLTMLMNDNMGNRITDVVAVGMKTALFHYLNQLPNYKGKEVTDVQP